MWTFLKAYSETNLYRIFLSREITYILMYTVENWVYYIICEKKSDQKV